MAASVKILFAETIGTNPPTPFTKGGSYGVSSDSVDFNLIGQNPAQADALSVLCRDNAPFASAGLGFTTNFLAATAYQESRFAEFTDIQGCSPTLTTSTITDGYPVQACDNGYGIMQLTQGIPGGLTYNLNRYTGTPTQTMIWNWVANINAGENVMLSKLQWALMYSSQNYQWSKHPAYVGCTFLPMTPDQLQMETWQAYNGGSFYIVDTSNYPLSCGWTPNISLCIEQDNTCGGAFPAGEQCYADCAKYEAQTTPGSSSGWCK